MSILFLVRTHPLHCRKLAAILGKSEPQIARKLSRLEKAGIVEGRWVHKGRNIKVYSLKADTIQLTIGENGLEVQYIKKKDQFFTAEQAFQIEIPETTFFVDREPELLSLDTSSFSVLTGIAGIGKTSLASVYAHKLQKQDKYVFWHLFSELDTTMHIVKKLALFLAQHNFPQTLDYIKADGSSIQVVYALLAEGMSNPQCAFFFDDYHVTTDDSLHELFNQLKGTKAKICVISRYIPDFVSTFDTIEEIKLEEMGKDAVCALLEKKGVTIGAGLETVSEKVGGHPLALELLCQAVSHESHLLIKDIDIPSFEINAYLWDEVYTTLEPEEQELLIILSIFRNPVPVSTLEDLCSFPHVWTVLKQLTKKNLLKHVDGRYTHHSVTREFCLNVAPNVNELHRRAAEVCIHEETPQGLLEGVYHLEKIGDTQKAAKIIVDNSEELVNQGYADKLFFYCDTLMVADYYYPLLQIKGELHKLRGEYDTAITCFEKVLDYTPEKAGIYRNLGEVYTKKREYTTAETFFLKGLDFNPDTVEKGTILVQLAAVYEGLSNPEKALSCCEDALVCFSETEYKKGIAQVYSQMGRIFRFSDTDKALDVLSSSLKISSDIGDMQEVANIYVTMGTVVYERGLTEKAGEYFEKALKISEQIGDMVGIARCSNNLGVKYALEYKWPQAMRFYTRTLEICEKIKDKKGISFSYSNLGRAYTRLGQLEKGLEYFFAGLKIREDLGDKREMGFVCSDIGTTYERMGEFSQALDWLEKSLALRKESGHILGEAYCYVNMGRIYGELGDFEKALDLLVKARAIHEKEKGTWMVATTEVCMAQVYVYKGHYEKAVELTEKVVGNTDITDIILVIEANRVAAEAVLGLKKVDKARTYCDTALERALHIGSVRREGMVRRVKGKIFLETGEVEKAEDEFRLSVQLLEKYLFEQAKTFVQLALLCRVKGVDEKVHKFLKTAKGVFEKVGSHYNEEYCKRYLEE
jgi:tetratricopeptide (TPR) repeat protein/DNA-binding transcriptional ArsR family regulator